jgi:catechol 2,3-dioxygenase-like lactoylglutathione lyase family enzyme
MAVESLSAITLATGDVDAAVSFYRVLGFEVVWEGRDRRFVTLRSGDAWLNLFRAEGRSVRGWGRFILYVDDVDATWRALREAGYVPEVEPSDATWGERYFHVLDPAGHEVSVAKRIRGR